MCSTISSSCVLLRNTLYQGHINFLFRGQVDEGHLNEEHPGEKERHVCTDGGENSSNLNINITNKLTHVHTLYCAALHCTALYSTTLYCTTLLYSTMCLIY